MVKRIRPLNNMITQWHYKNENVIIQSENICVIYDSTSKGGIIIKIPLDVKKIIRKYNLTKKVFSSLTRRSGVILYGNPAKAFLDERINTQTIPSAIIKLTEPHHGIKGEKIFTMFKNTTKGMEIFEKCSDEWIELSGKVVKDKKAEPYSGRHRCMVETFIGTNKPCEAFIDGYVQYLD